MNEESSPSQVEIWWARHEALGRAQARYLYLLTLACVFYAYVWYEKVCDNLGDYESPADVELPLLQEAVRPLLILKTAPLFLALVLLAILGAMSATGVSADSLEKRRPHMLREAFDKTPNFLDMMMYVGPKAPKIAVATAWLIYPGLLVIAYAEAFAFLCIGFTVRPRQTTTWETIVLWTGIFGLVVATPRLARFIWRRLGRAYRAMK